MREKKWNFLMAWGFVLVLMVVALLTNNGGFDFWAHDGIWSVTPPLVVLLLMLATRRLPMSLLGGVVFGAWLISLKNLNPLPALTGMATNTAQIFVKTVGNKDGAALLLLMACTAGMGGILSASGGIYALGAWLGKRIKGPIGAQIATLVIGALCSFDGRAGALISGMATRTAADLHGVSRPRTAFLLRVGAALSLGILFASYIDVWSGDQAFLWQAPYDYSFPYRLFAYGFPLFALAGTLTLRNFGPMAKAEYLSRAGQTDSMADEGDGLAQTQEDLLGPKEGKGLLVNGLIPLLLLFSGALIRLFTGIPMALFLSVLAACAVALITALATKALTITRALQAWLDGIKGAVPLLLTLVLSLALGNMTADLGAGNFLSQLELFDLPASLLPALFFLISGGIAFATGSTTAAMGVMLSMAMAFSEVRITSLLTGAVISGALWGEQCSPATPMISIASLGAQCNPLAHYKTHLPYALVCGLCCLLTGYLPMGLGLSVWIALPLFLLCCVGLPFLLGKRIAPTPSIAKDQGFGDESRKIELLRQNDRLYKRKHGISRTK